MLHRARSLLNRLSIRAAAPKVENSADYWEQRYAAAGSSGTGSYGRLAEFKAEVLNRFVQDNAVRSVIEFGCGDGAQLKLAQYPAYLGLDVSQNSIRRCQTLFAGDATKRFAHYTGWTDETADLTLSLDVIYHLVEDAVFDRYMRNLFAGARRFVIAYASNHDDDHAPVSAAHVRHRKFTDWIDRTQGQDWTLTARIANRYPYNPLRKRDTSFADFYVYSRTETRREP